MKLERGVSLVEAMLTDDGVEKMMWSAMEFEKVTLGSVQNIQSSDHKPMR